MSGIPVSESEGKQEMKSGEKLTITIELVFLTSRSTSSCTLRGCGQSAYAELWEKMTGAALPLPFSGRAPRASSMVCLLTCERSTSIPSLFISLTMTWPASLRPPQ